VFVQTCFTTIFSASGFQAQQSEHNTFNSFFQVKPTCQSNHTYFSFVCFSLVFHIFLAKAHCHMSDLHFSYVAFHFNYKLFLAIAKLFSARNECGY